MEAVVRCSQLGHGLRSDARASVSNIAYGLLTQIGEANPKHRVVITGALRRDASVKKRSMGLVNDIPDRNRMVLWSIDGISFLVFARVPPPVGSGRQPTFVVYSLSSLIPQRKTSNSVVGEQGNVRFYAP